MSANEKWTPYGLEAIRIRYLRRRRVLAILIALTLVGVWAAMFQTDTSSEIQIFANGKRANGISIDEPDQPKEQGPVRVEIAPGRVTRAESGGAPEPASTISRASVPTFSRAPPIPYQAYVIIYGPFLLLALAAMFLAKKKGRHDQVNYGIYKGAMPLEMVSASMSQHIFTSRWTKTGLFDKRREHYLPDEVVRIERVSQEEA